MKSVLLVLIFSGLFFTHAAAQKKTKHKSSASAKPSVITYGTASYYAKKFEQRRTANGEIYSSKKYSAACNVLPLGTWIRVTNIRNDKSLVVRINDRLKSKNKRLLDLSWIAAKDLGYTSRGLTRVKIEVLRDFHLASE